jgi:hypothetical protein
MDFVDPSVGFFARACKSDARFPRRNSPRLSALDTQKLSRRKREFFGEKSPEKSISRGDFEVPGGLREIFRSGQTFAISGKKKRAKKLTQFSPQTN